MLRKPAFIKRTSQFIAALLTMVSCIVVADELSGYVQNCENELEFAPWEVPTLDCNDGTLFKGGNLSDNSPGQDFVGGPVNDVVGHARINSSVDLVFACRWLNNNKPRYAQTAVSIELLIHNRFKGGTCFFAAKDSNPPGTDPTSVESKVSTTIVPVTASNASSYWMQPTALNAKQFSTGPGDAFPNGSLRCIGCHIAGPYIASPDIAAALAQFGLLNDGHDTFATKYYAVVPPSVVPGTQSPLLWWTLATRIYNSTTGAAACAAGCHSIGLNSPADPLFSFATNIDSIVPSLKDDIDRVAFYRVMPANDPPNKNLDNSYNWVNMSSPFSDSGDFESLNALSILYPKFYCSNPVSVEAHIVDQDIGYSFRTNEIPDKLYQFNLQDGLVCRNGDQPGGRRCQDYQTRYWCNGKFTAFQNLDTPSGAGDWEPRNSRKDVCSNSTWMQARYQRNGVWVYVNAPADRLAEFDTGGLVCFNSDQKSGQCSNYVVRFNCQ